jgi:hypothetical protein
VQEDGLLLHHAQEPRLPPCHVMLVVMRTILKACFEGKKICGMLQRMPQTA